MREQRNPLTARWRVYSGKDPPEISMSHAAKNSIAAGDFGWVLPGFDYRIAKRIAQFPLFQSLRNKPPLMNARTLAPNDYVVRFGFGLLA